MNSRKEEFRALMKKQLDELHKSISELEELAPHPHEHAISWDTVVGECRKKHLETAARLRELDDHSDETWHDTGTDIRDAVEDLQREVEQRTKKKA
jgi:gas vesicle protein